MNIYISNKKKASMVSFLILASLLVVSVCSAQVTGSNGEIELENPFKSGSDLFSLVKAIINNIVMPIGGMLAVLAFIWSGFKYVTARGNENEVKKAHAALLYTAIGTAILFGAWAAANVIEATIKQL